MIIKVKYRAIWNRRGKLDKSKKAPLTIEAYQNPHRRYFYFGLSLSPDQWDDKRKEVKGNPNYNRLIRAKINELETFELMFPTIHNRPFKLRDFDLMDISTEPQKINRRTFSDLIMETLKGKRSKWEESTWKNYKRSALYLVEFNGGKPVEFDQLTYKFISDYDSFLWNEKGLSGSIYKVHQLAKRFIVLAVKEKLMDNQNNPYNDFSFKKPSTERIVLHDTEMKRIEELTFSSSNQHLAFYRDAFLIGYYTLLRISDVTAIRQQNIISTDKGMMLEIKAKKGGKINRLPIYELHKNATGLSKPEHILERYARLDKEPLFDRSHPIINEYLKDVLQLAKIDKPATFHTSRHSGITCLVNMNLPLPYIQKLAQHRSIQTTMIYVHIANATIESALSKLDWLKSGAK